MVFCIAKLPVGHPKAVDIYDVEFCNPPHFGKFMTWKVSRNFRRRGSTSRSGPCEPSTSPPRPGTCNYFRRHFSDKRQKSRNVTSSSSTLLLLSFLCKIYLSALMLWVLNEARRSLIKWSKEWLSPLAIVRRQFLVFSHSISCKYFAQ